MTSTCPQNTSWSKKRYAKGMQKGMQEGCKGMQRDANPKIPPRTSVPLAVLGSYRWAHYRPRWPRPLAWNQLNHRMSMPVSSWYSQVSFECPLVCSMSSNSVSSSVTPEDSLRRSYLLRPYLESHHVGSRQRVYIINCCLTNTDKETQLSLNMLRLSKAHEQAHQDWKEWGD